MSQGQGQMQVSVMCAYCLSMESVACQTVKHGTLQVYVKSQRHFEHSILSFVYGLGFRPKGHILSTKLRTRNVLETYICSQCDNFEKD